MTKKVPISIFVACGPTDPKSGIFPIGSDLFELRCFAGVVELAPDLTAQPLPALLSLLERYGLRGVRIDNGANSK